ncbi:MAG: porphobilinogen synthase [Alphaproteobacteria bacterium]|nr:porphobilinogen synthase [Alphaproteobacteria bacterium]
MNDYKSISAPAFPQTRMRRTRQADWSRRLVRESHLSANDFIWPVFVVEGSGVIDPVPSMPGVERVSVDVLVDRAKEAAELGIPAIAPFPNIEDGLKDPKATLAADPQNVICRAVRAVKQEVPGIGVICDVALDPFSSDGHCGLVIDGVIDNDATNEMLVKQSLVQAEAGADVLGPSDMMDGRVGVIRQALDAAGYQDRQIMSYAAKYASAYYGPFRDAVGSSGTLAGASKSTYQMDSANSDEALREVALDLAEGADYVMVKPGQPYLDVVQRVKSTFQVPTFSYQVSGEYAMLKGAIQNGWLDNDRVVLESLTSFKRAGADAILTYLAIEAAKLLKAG